jgi:hypothetical protein
MIGGDGVKPLGEACLSRLPAIRTSRPQKLR